MIVGIDACNIRFGGGLTHLVELLKNLDFESSKIEKVIVWSNDATLGKIVQNPKIEFATNKVLNSNPLFCFLYQMFFLKKEIKKKQCSVVLVPGGIFLNSFKPFVTISQNILPFDIVEINRFKNYSTRLRLFAIRLLQIHTFKKANGIIFLTNFAKNHISKYVKVNDSVIIPHGIDQRFKKEPKVQKPISAYNFSAPFQLTYVSVINAYKHQNNVAIAVLNLLRKGYPIQLNLIGTIAQNEGDTLLQTLESNKDFSKYIVLKGNLSHELIFQEYHNSDGFIFASSCENLPLIMIEAMASGLPIVSSNMGPMPEVLGENDGFYINPLHIENIELKIEEFIEKHHLRTTIAEQSYKKSLNYSWKFTSTKTFDYLSKVAKIK